MAQVTQPLVDSDDNKIGNLKTTVQRVAIVLALFGIIGSILTAVFVSQKSYAWRATECVISILCALLIPACGFFATKKDDSRLAFAFCCCSLCQGIGAVISMIFSIVLVATIKQLVRTCDPSKGTDQPDTCPSEDVWKSMCNNELSAQECHDKITEFAMNASAFIITLIVLVQCFQAALYCSAFYFGQNFYNHLKTGVAQLPPQNITTSAVNGQYGSTQN